MCTCMCTCTCMRMRMCMCMRMCVYTTILVSYSANVEPFSFKSFPHSVAVIHVSFADMQGSFAEMYPSMRVYRGLL